MDLLQSNIEEMSFDIISLINTYSTTDKMILNTFLKYVKNHQEDISSLKIMTVILYFSIKNNDINLVQYCLDNGANPGIIDFNIFILAQRMGLDIGTDSNGGGDISGNSISDTGLSTEQHNNLDHIVYNKINTNNFEMCSICHIDFEIDDNLIKTRCNHFYHKACITQWFNRSTKCPNCWSSVV